MKNFALLGTLTGLLALLGACTYQQRDSALVAMRDLQSSGVAQAAEPGLPAQAPVKLPGSPAQEGAAPPAGAPPADPPPAGDSAPAEDGAAKTPEEIIKEFVENDPREILASKSKDLKERQTNPSDEDKPETFIPETGRKDPMTLVLDSIPEELRPPRSADEDDSELETYLYTAIATQALQQVTASLRCHSVIQIGIQKYAQMSFEGQGGRFTVSEGQGFNTGAPGPVPMNIAISIVSISTDEVVANVSVTPQGSTINVSKDLVFIPRI